MEKCRGGGRDNGQRAGAERLTSDEGAKFIGAEKDRGNLSEIGGGKKKSGEVVGVARRGPRSGSSEGPVAAEARRDERRKQTKQGSRKQAK